MTRLADLTGLDCIGVPVFHAVRPTSRAIAVHQGKGLTRWAAQMGALMEAIESAHAEAFDIGSRVAAYSDLPPRERPACLDDFAETRALAVEADDPRVWTTAERLLDAAPMLVPLDCVSLDYARAWDVRLDHTSNGLGAGFSDEDAIGKGLLEVLERDAAAEWRRLPLGMRAACAVDRRSIPYPWFQELADRLRRHELSLSVFSAPSLTGLPIVYAQVRSRDWPRRLTSVVGGWACAARPQEALQAALLEALQVRLTYIAGVRDDLLYGTGAACGPAGEACLPPPQMQALHWDAVAGGCEADGLTAWRIAEILAARGYPETAWVRLTPPDGPVCVAKVLAPGLAAFDRSRRAPLEADG